MSLRASRLASRLEHRVRETLGGGHRFVAGHTRGRDERAHRLQARALRLHQRLERSQRRFRLRERVVHRIQLGAHRRRARAVVEARAGRARLRPPPPAAGATSTSTVTSGEDVAPAVVVRPASVEDLRIVGTARREPKPLGGAVGRKHRRRACRGTTTARATASRARPAPDPRPRPPRLEARTSSRRSVRTLPGGTGAPPSASRGVEATRRGKRRQTSAGARASSTAMGFFSYPMSFPATKNSA